MNKAWPLATIGEVLQLQRRWLRLEPDQLYTEIGVRSFGKGIFRKNPVTGLSLGNKRVLRICPGDLVFNNVFAWEGAVGVASETEAGTIGSHRFVTYTVKDNQADAHFVRLFFRTEAGLQVLRNVSPGSAGRNRTLNLDHFARQQIPLPPFPEQQQIVAKVEELAVKAEEASAIQEKSSAEVSSLAPSAMNEIWCATRKWSESPLGELVTTVAGQVMPTIEPYASLPHINGESMESGTGRLLPTYRSAKEDGVISGKYHFRPGSVLYSKIRPYLRKAVVVPFEGLCSADVYAFDTINPQVQPHFLKYALIAPDFTEYACRLSGRTRMPKLNQKQLFSYSMRFPPPPEQRRIVAYLDGLQAKVDAMKTMQAQSAAELDALLPSILDRAFKGELG
jgi:type I restriction enzyme S subunit